MATCYALIDNAPCPREPVYNVKLRSSIGIQQLCHTCLQHITSAWPGDVAWVHVLDQPQDYAGAREPQ